MEKIAPWFSVFGRAFFALSVLATVSVSVYRSYFGEGAITAFVYPINVALWATTIILGLCLIVIWNKQRLDARPADKIVARRANRIMLAGVALGLLPVPWLIFATYFLHNGSNIGSLLAIVPALFFLIAGNILIFYGLIVFIALQIRRPNSS